MASHGIRDRVAIVGVGCTSFGEHWDKSADDLLIDATGMTLSRPAEDRLQASDPGREHVRDRI
jgi:acetyl-CoA C-acetyltransferase